jgi:pimeloyl-ACP methyl ester carboxylesterase
MKVVGMPRPVIFLMRLMPGFKELKAVAHTLSYDFAILGDTQRGGPVPEELKAAPGSVTVPTLTLAGGKSPYWLKHAATVVAGHIGDARTAIVPGQSHNLAAKAIAPILVEFFAPEG